VSASTKQPDILEVIADLSNDEVRTSPRIVNQVLDLLPEEVWEDETLRWLDPGCKTGSFYGRSQSDCLLVWRTRSRTNKSGLSTS
jgi:hypothetical protein